jgi:hypothetical protein
MIGGHWTAEFVHTLKFCTGFMSGARVDLEQGLGSTTLLLADMRNPARSESEQERHVP